MVQHYFNRLKIKEASQILFFLIIVINSNNPITTPIIMVCLVVEAIILNQIIKAILWARTIPLNKVLWVKV